MSSFNLVAYKFTCVKLHTRLKVFSWSTIFELKLGENCFIILANKMIVNIQQFLIIN